MAYRLTNLKIDRVDLVDKGANFDHRTGDGAHVMLFKRDTSERVDHIAVARVIETIRATSVTKGATAEADVFTQADARVSAGTATTRAQAVDDVLLLNPDLQKRYAAEREALMRGVVGRPSITQADASILAGAITKAAAGTPLGSLNALAAEWVETGRAGTREQAIAAMSTSPDPEILGLVAQAREADARVDHVLFRISQRLSAMARDQRAEHLRQLIASSPGFVSELLDALESRIGVDLA